MPVVVEPTYVRHLHGKTIYKILTLDTYYAVLEVYPSGSLYHVTREYIAKQFIVVDQPHTTVTYAKQQALAASAFLAAHAGSNYLQHPNNNHRSSMGICR